MIVLAAGMPRSGSTFSFNVAREILQTKGTVYHEACDDLVGAACRSGGTDHLLVKAHNLNPASLALARSGAIRIIMTVRRVEDAMASWFSTFDAVPEATSFQIMRDWLEIFRQLRSHALIVPYEQINCHSWYATWRIARHLHPTVGPFRVLAIARRYAKIEVKRLADAIPRNDAGVVDIGFSHYDHRTFFHRGHISRLQSYTAEDVLPEERLAAIREALGEAMTVADLPLF